MVRRVKRRVVADEVLAGSEIPEEMVGFRAGDRVYVWVWVWGEGRGHGDYNYLTPRCHHQNASCIKMGGGVSMFTFQLL